MKKKGNVALHLIKICLVTVAFWMLFKNNDIDFSKLKFLLQDVVFLSVLCLAIAIGMGLTVVIRWRMLLKAVGINITIFDLYRISWIGQFFTIIFPGSISADVVKAIYISKISAVSDKTLLLASILVDKVIGLFSILFIALASSLIYFNVIKNNILILGLTISVAGLFFVMSLLITVILARKRDYNQIPINNNILKILRIQDICGKLFVSICMYAEKKRVIGYGLLLSLLVQLQLILVFVYIASKIHGGQNPIWGYFFVVPLGELTTAIPVAPAGIGVGHLAFNSLFELVGQGGGADIFNLFTVVRLGISCLGAILFLLHKPDSSLFSSPRL